jgi:hypothetical protein
MTFEQFHHQVNQQLRKVCGLTSQDIDDYDYWTAWSAGDSPRETALCALENAGLDVEDQWDKELN